MNWRLTTLGKKRDLNWDGMMRRWKSDSNGINVTPGGGLNSQLGVTAGGLRINGN